MMTQRIHTAVAIAVSVSGLLIGMQPALAAQAPFPTKAKFYSTWLVRAMDECTSPTTTVLTMGSPPAGCIQQNTATDDGDPMTAGATMNFARLAVRRLTSGSGRITLFGAGFQGGQRMKVQLTLRVTKGNQQTKHPPDGGVPQNVTFEDVTVKCGNNTLTGCFVANLSGRVAGSMTLGDCMTQNSESTSLASGNIQILDSALLNCDTNKIFATPGILN